MKPLDDVITAVENDTLDDDTRKDAVMYLELLQGLMHDAMQYFEYYAFHNKEENDDENAG